MITIELEVQGLEQAFELVQGDLITRKDLVHLTGVSKSKIANIVHSKFLNFPNPAGKIDRETVWNRAEVLDWLETHDVHADLPLLSGNGNLGNGKPGLDNKLALEFLRLLPK